MLNKCCFIGNVGKEPEIRTTQAGKEIANFSLAVSERWKDHASGERKEKTEWVKVVVFNDGLVGIIKQYIKKGSKLYIEGQLQTRKWSDNQGQDKYSTEVVLQTFGGMLVMLNKLDVDSSPALTEERASVPASPLIDDEIPF